MADKKKGNVRFIRIRGRIVPIRSKDGAEVRKRQRNFVTGESGRKITSSSGLKAQGRKFLKNLGIRDTLTQATFLKGRARKSFVKGAKSQLRLESKNLANTSKVSLGLGAAATAVGAIARSKGSILLGLGGLALGGLSDLSAKSAASSAKSFDKDLSKSSKSWEKFLASQRKRRGR